MRSVQVLALLSITVALVGPVKPGHAAIVSETYDFSGSKFLPLAPKDPFTGEITLTFDDSLDYQSQTSGISFTSPGFTLGSQLAFTYLHAADTLVVGGLAATVFSTDSSTSDFSLYVSKATTAPAVTFLSYSVGSGTVYTSTANSISFAAVPEPSSCVLFVTGILAACAARWAGRFARIRNTAA